MESFSAAIIYLAFFGLIAFVVYYTGSPWALWALLLTPTIRMKK